MRCAERLYTRTAAFPVVYAVWTLGMRVAVFPAMLGIVESLTLAGAQYGYLPALAPLGRWRGASRAGLLEL